MKRLIARGLVLCAGAASLQVAAPPDSPKVDYRSDARLGALRDFFQDINGPAIAYAQEFLQAADDYALDWRLLPSISCIETTGGRYAPGNNLFGWDSGRARFPTAPAAIHMVAYRLTHGDHFGPATLDQKLARYNPDSGYARKVKAVMRRIAPSE